MVTKVYVAGVKGQITCLDVLISHLEGRNYRQRTALTSKIEDDYQQGQIFSHF